MTYHAKYHHLELKVYPDGDKWRAEAKDQFRTTVLENRYNSAEEAQNGALIAADGHLQRFYQEIKYASMPAERIRWVNVEK